MARPKAMAQLPHALSSSAKNRITMTTAIVLNCRFR